MTLDTRRQIIYCDGDHCEATTLPPVALRVSLAGAYEGEYRASGWTFIVGNGKELHFCPKCSPGCLSAILANTKP